MLKPVSDSRVEAGALAIFAGGKSDRPARAKAAAAMALPIELVERLVGPMGLAAMIRDQVRGATFLPIASLRRVGDRWVAEIEFAAPIGPERQSALVVMLGVKVRR